MNREDTDQLVQRIVDRVHDEVGLAYARKTVVKKRDLERAVRRVLTDLMPETTRTTTPREQDPLKASDKKFET